MPNGTRSHYINGLIKDDLNQLHEKYVMTPADKAQNNILFICKPYYVKVTKNELSPQHNQTYQLSNAIFDHIINETCNFSANMGVPLYQ